MQTALQGEALSDSRNGKKHLDTGSLSGLVSESGGERLEVSNFEGVKPAETGTVHSKVMPQVMPKVQDLVNEGGGKVTVLLDPPEMGKLTIEVTTRGKHVELAIHADNDKTRAALEGGMADLQIAMQNVDLQLTHTEVHSTQQSSASSMQFGESQSGREHSSSGEGSRSFGRQERQVESRSLFTETPVTRTRSAGRLDVRV